MPNKKNLEEVNKLREKVKEAKTIILADYQGLDVNQVNNLRSKIKETDAEVSISKNSLLQIALEEENIDTKDLSKGLKGPTAAVFAYKDSIAPFKIISEFAKKLELPKMKAAIVEGIFQNAEKCEELSNLPSKEQLLARLVGGLISPITGIVNVFGGTQTKFVRALSAIADKKEVSN